MTDRRPSTVAHTAGQIVGLLVALIVIGLAGLACVWVWATLAEAVGDL